MGLSRSLAAHTFRAVSVSGMVDDMARSEKFAYALREAMKARGISADELATLMNRGRRTIYRWTEGKGAPTVLEAGPLSKVLGVHPMLFIDPPDIPEPPVYPLAEFLLPEAQAGFDEGVRRAQRRAREEQ